MESPSFVQVVTSIEKKIQLCIEQTSSICAIENKFMQISFLERLLLPFNGFALTQTDKKGTRTEVKRQRYKYMHVNCTH